MTAAGVCTLGDYAEHICILLVKYAICCGTCCSFTSQESLRQKPACRVRLTPACAAGTLPGLGKGSSVTFGLHSASAAGKGYFRFAKSSLFVIYYTELSLAGLDSVHKLKWNSRGRNRGMCWGTIHRYAPGSKGWSWHPCRVLRAGIRGFPTRESRGIGKCPWLCDKARHAAVWAGHCCHTAVGRRGAEGLRGGPFYTPPAAAVLRTFAFPWAPLPSLTASGAFIPSKWGTATHGVVISTQISPVSNQAWKHPRSF